MHNISPFQFITNDFSEQTALEQIEMVCRAGCRWVQLRIKNQPDIEILLQGKEARKICSRYDAKLILNDYAHLAKEIGADGIHLGKQDVSPSDARKLLGNNFIIGGTANTFEDIANLYAQGVDYVGIGPYRFTSTKKNLAPVLGLEGYRRITQECSKAGIHLPMVAIGGIQPEDVDPLLRTGVTGIALSSAITMAKDIEKETEIYFELLNQTRYANA